MATSQTTLNLSRSHPGLTFWVLWLLASFVGAMVYFLPVGAVQLLLGLSDSGGPDFPPAFSQGARVLAAVLCGAACGSTIGLAQWLVLRTQLPRAGAWVGATIAGYACLGLLPVVAGLLQPGWLDWALTLIVNGKLYWLARVLSAWPTAAWAPGAVTLTLFGAVLGLFQWLFLRGRILPPAGWIALNAMGWALSAALWLLPSEPGPSLTLELTLTVMVAPLVPYALAGAGLVWLLGRPSRAESQAAT